MGFKQGLYKIRNPQKYRGDVTNIRYMSSWELKMHQFLDNNPNILEWSSEELAIPYFHPFKKRPARYYPDYLVKYKNRKGEVIYEMLEVKPAKQTKPTCSRNPKQRLYEQATYAVNIAKWQSAQKYCDKYGLKFKLITENEIFR